MKGRLSLVLCIMLASALAVPLAACSRQAEKAELKKTITRYTEFLTEGYRTFNMSKMGEVATKLQAENLYIHMAAMGEGGSRMDSTLKRIDFLEFAFEGKDKAVVRTREVWDYKHIDTKTGNITLEEKDFVYEIGYHLVREAGPWKIAKVVVVRTSDSKVDPKLKGPSDRSGATRVGSAPEQGK